MYHRERSNSTNNLLYQQQHLQQQFRNASNSTYANDEDDYVERSGDQDDYEGRMYNDVDGGDDNGESYDGGRGSNNNNNNNSYQSNDYLEVMSNSSRSSASRNSGHYNKVDPAETNKNFKVVIRVRPPLPRELEAGKNFVNIAKIEHDNVIILSENLANEGQEGVYTTHSFTFDKVYGPDSQQKDVYEHTAKEAVLSTLQGYNATMIAYGQTGTGKTYTMEGFTNDEQRGIVPRATEEIFNYIQNTSDPKTKFLVRASYLQIYNEVISDLLKPERKNLMIREDKKRGVFVEGLSEWVVRSPAEIYGLMERGGSVRATGATKMNEMSSRSHAVFIIICEQSETTLVNNEGKELGHEDVSELLRKKSSEITRMSTDFKQSFKIGKLNLVDLAGSERVRYTGATGVRLEESKKINQSLSALGNVIAALTDSRGRQHIPYRDSKLTRILADSLGGNCKTTMMAMISPALESFAETLSTVKFANRSKNIKNEAHVNEDLDQRALLRKYERELKKLRAELEEKSKNVVSKRRLLELEEQKKRAEEDKLAAITALEKRSREFMQEKLEKRKLEEKIARMQSQLLIGGQKIEDTPQFRHAIQQSLQKVHKQYEDKLAELERERQTIEEDKAQVDRYKQLLLKQRDIMIALTARLNERDESILGLQEELDAYDGHQRMMEDALDQKTASLIHLQRVALEQNLNNAQRQQLLSALGEWAIDYGAQQQYQQPVSKDNERRYPPHESQVVFGLNSDGDGPYLLTAEEKIQELTRLLEKHQGDQSMVAQELEEVQAEKVSMEYLLREKLEKMVQNEIEERINAYKREVEHWKSLLAVAEEKCRAAEYKAELSKLDSGSAEFRDKISDILRREMEILQKPFNEKAAQMKADLEKAVAEKKKAVAECDKLRLELETLKQMQKTNTKFYAAQQLQLQQQQQLQHQKMSEASSKIEDQAAMLRNYEEQIKRLQQQQQQQHNSSSASTSGSGNTAEITMLKQQIATSMKERQALKTILEAKIKSMVDSISRQINSITATQSPPDSQKLALQKDITALQKLVNASIQAMKNSEEEMKELYGASAFTGSNSNNNNISTTTNNNNSNGGSVSGASLSTSSSNSSLSSMDSTSSSSSSSVPSTPTSAVTPTAITSSAFSSRSSQLQQQRQPSAQLRSSATTPVSGTSSSSSSSYTHHRSSSFSSTSSPYVSASVAGNNNSAINNGNSNSSSSINNNNNSSNDHNTQQNLLQQRKLQQQQLVEQLLEQNKRSKEQQQQQQMQYSSSHSSSLNGGNTTYHHYN